MTYYHEGLCKAYSEPCQASTEASYQRGSLKRVFLKIFQNSQENPCLSLYFNKVAGLRPAFYCELCVIFKNIYFEEHLLTAASDRILNTHLPLRPALESRFCVVLNLIK